MDIKTSILEYNSEANTNRLEIINVDEALEIEDDINKTNKTRSNVYIGSLFCILFSTVIIISLYISLFLKEKPLTTQIERISFFKFELILYFLMAISFWTFFLILISIVNNNYDSKSGQYSVFSTFLNNHDNHICFVSTSLCTSFFVLIYSSIIKNKIISSDSSEAVSGVQAAKNISLWSSFIDNFPNITMGISMFILIIFLKDMVVNLTVYKMHFNSYKDRIKDNSKNLRIIESLNRVGGRTMYDNVGDWARYIFFCISSDKKGVTFDDLKRKFNANLIKAIYSYFDCKTSKKISEKEFVMMYKAIIKERQCIASGLDHKKHLVKKFNWISSFFIYPLGFLCLQNIAGLSCKTVNIVENTQLLLSINFIFASVAKDVFSSLVFTFLVRSFDINDILVIDDKIHTVLDIGIMYSEFLKDSKVVIISNTKLRNVKITNYRLSQLKDTEFVFTIQTEDFTKDKKVIVKEIQRYIKRNRKYYKHYCKIKDYSANKDNGKKTIKIVLSYKIKYNKIEKIMEEEDDFRLFIIEFFKRNRML